jgi:molybdenum cofactor synthesis domain-containing protein
VAAEGEAAGAIVAAVCVGAARQGPRSPRDAVTLVRGVGIAEDGQRGTTHRQLCLMAAHEGAGEPGALGENLRTRGLALGSIADGRRLRIGARAVIQVTDRATIATAGDEAPRLQVFARCVRGGEVRPGDAIATDPSFDRPRYAVLTLSDRRAGGALPDESGALAVTMLSQALAAPPIAVEVLPDDAELIKARLVTLADEHLCDLIVTTGGTGLAPRDVTPEATLAVIDRQVPGIAEAIRAGGLAKTPLAMLSRAVAGQRGSTLIVNLSGSPRAVREQLEVLVPVLPHVLTTASGVPQSCGQGVASDAR